MISGYAAMVGDVLPPGMATVTCWQAEREELPALLYAVTT
jgi:hypothetical protein